MYFLLCDGEVVYVGSSVRPAVRSKCHGEKLHDAVLFLPAAETKLLSLEREWIRALLPKYNKAHNPTVHPPSVTIHTAIDEQVCKQLRRYMDSRPDGAMLRRVTERAYAMLLEAEGFWPPPDEPKKGRNRPPDERGHK